MIPAIIFQPEVHHQALPGLQRGSGDQADLRAGMPEGAPHESPYGRALEGRYDSLGDARKTWRSFGFGGV
ncbi:MAG TPA: hypothetical protein VGP62_01875 [Bryobacteraceae bacterium]|nr:hypothetical protein [Bryobacteraceae bacterium]